MINEFPNDFYLPDEKNSRISQIINKWIFGRQTPDSNEGVGVEIPYLECAYGTKYYVVDQINGNISAIHDNSIEPTDFFGCFSPFNLKELEFNECRITDHHNNVRWFLGWTMTTGDRWPQTGPSPTNSNLQPRTTYDHFMKSEDMVHDGQVFSTEQCTNLYFHHVEVINNLVESFPDVFYTHNQPPRSLQLNTEPKQSKQASYYEKVIRNINIVLTDGSGMSHSCKGLPQVPSPRYDTVKKWIGKQ